VNEFNPTATTTGAGRPATNGHRALPPDFTGRPPDHPDYAPFDNPDSKLARSNPEDARKERWKNQLYALSSLEGRHEPWARHIVTAAAYQAARRDPVREGPGLTFTGDNAVGAGATDDEIAALPALSPDEIANLQLERAAIREVTRQQIRRRAAGLAMTRRPLSEVIRLAKDMVSDPPAGVIVDKLLHEKTVTSWVGDGGTFKSFTVLGLACSVAAIDPLDSLLRPKAGKELRAALEGIRFSDLTLREVYGLIAIIEPVAERVAARTAAAAPVVKLSVIREAKSGRVKR
jgi:hypothetical protein